MAPLMPPQPVEGDYYQVLDLPFDAPEEDIRRRYHAIMRSLHPDRQRQGSAVKEEVKDRFHKVQSAWWCLSDPTRRLLYDLRNFGRSSVGGEEVGDPDLDMKLSKLQKSQVERDIANMQVQLERILRRERASRGVVVHKALYGDLRVKRARLQSFLAENCATIVEDDLTGPFCDVSTPVQCLVESHQIVLPGGASVSKADLPGFFNPLPLDVAAELHLYVLYEFKGKMHEVLVGDHEMLALPRRPHAIPPQKPARGPFSPGNVALLHGASAPTRGETGEVHLSCEAALAQDVMAYREEAVRLRGKRDAGPREFLAVSVIGTIFLAALAFSKGRRS